MKHYLKVAIKGFGICAVIGFLLVVFIDIVPSERKELEFLTVYFSVSGGFIACFRAIVGDVLSRRGPWRDPRSRFFCVPALGASLGLLVLGWVALGQGCALLQEPFWWRLISGSWGPVQGQAYDLFSRLQLLTACKTFLESGAQYAAIFAAGAMATVWLYDHARAAQ